jgi:predicted nucleic acid-binding protein
MMMKPEPPVFIDTNILLRYDVRETPEHAQVRHAVRSILERGSALWISRQILREYCRAVTHPTFSKPLTMPQAVARVRQLRPFFHVADEDEYVTQYLMTLLETVPIGGKQVHDANIIATMQAHGLTHLLTLNLDDFHRFNHLVILLDLQQPFL